MTTARSSPAAWWTARATGSPPSTASSIPTVAADSLGSFIVLRLIEEARRRGLPYVYLGYWIAASRKMAYKIRFQPLEAFGAEGWAPMDSARRGGIAGPIEVTRRPGLANLDVSPLTLRPVERPTGETKPWNAGNFSVGRRRAPPRWQRWPRAFPSPPSPTASPRSNGASPPAIPKSLDTIFGAPTRMCQRIAAATDGKFQIRPFAAGEIVPGLQVLDAVQNGTVECGQTASYYYVGKDPDLRLRLRRSPSASTPASRTPGCMYGGGLELMREFFKDYNIIQFPAGNTGAQMGGWFRKEIKSVDDLKGLKFRIGGIRRQGAGQARRRAAADRRRRHLSGAGERHHRRGRMGRPL